MMGSVQALGAAIADSAWQSIAVRQTRRAGMAATIPGAMGAAAGRPVVSDANEIEASPGPASGAWDRSLNLRPAGMGGAVRSPGPHRMDFTVKVH